MDDIEKLLNKTFPFIEKLLLKYGEFYPVASAIKSDDTIALIGTYDGDDKPLSDRLIADLKTSIKAKQSEYKLVTIYYDVKVIDPNTGLKTDAVSVFVESKFEKTAFIYFYPYILTRTRELRFSKSWKNETNKEIFNNQVIDSPM